MKKKELWIINHYATPPGYGGLTRHYYLAKYLEKLGFSVKIFAASAIHNSSFNFIEKNDKSLYKETVIDGVTYVHVKTRQYTKNNLQRVFNILEFFFRSKKVLKKMAKNSMPMYVYSSSPTPFGSLVANKFAKKNGVKSVVETRDLWPYSMYAYNVIKSQKNPIYLVLKRIEKKMYLGADKLIFTMGNGIEYLKEQKYAKKIDMKKVYCVGNGMDFEEFNDNFLNFKTKDKDLENKKFKIIYTGSIRHIYNVEMLANLANLMKDYKNIEFLIYGKGDTTEIEKIIEENKLDNFKLKGFVESKYLPYIISKCDLALIHGMNSPVTKYGMSTNKEALYLACGIPVINVYKMANDNYKEHKCGITLDNYTLEDYREKILYFYNLSKEELEEYGKNAKKYGQNFSYEKLAKKLKDILED